ncbi:SCO3374 family protein [Streptomyces sp. NPDC089424]|uniref:SCO3374 family protein n=1 Tax=Streptomyces sp. NPDC089424 TaxID=3365917 RepID=UPI0037F31907
MVGAMPWVPPPRRPLDQCDRVRRWYEHELGWATVPGTPLHLSVGSRFDVLDVPAEAGLAGLRHLVPGSPVAVQGDRMRLLVAAGSAAELPGVLDWLEWGGLALDLRAVGGEDGASTEAPLPPDAGAGCRGGEGLTGDGAGGLRGAGSAGGAGGASDSGGSGAAEGGGAGDSGGRSLSCSGGCPEFVQGAAVWLRPPVPGCEVEASLPTLSAMGGVGGAPDLVRLLDTVATHCHRIRLRRARTQPLAFS